MPFKTRGSGKGPFSARYVSRERKVGKINRTHRDSQPIWPVDSPSAFLHSLPPQSYLPRIYAS